MDAKIKLVNIGEETGVFLPQEAMNRLGWEAGQDVFLVETEDGFEISSRSPKLQDAMEIAEDVMQRRRDVLRKLAE